MKTCKTCIYWEAPPMGASTTQFYSQQKILDASDTRIKNERVI